MAYLVKGRTFTSYWDVNGWRDRVEPVRFEKVVEAEDKDQAIENIRSLMQGSRGHAALIDYCEEIEVRKQEMESRVEWEEPWYTANIVAFDVETTGFSPRKDRIVEIGFSTYNFEKKRFEQGESWLINDGVPIPQELIDKQINDITNEMLEGKPTFAEAAKEFIPQYFGTDKIFIAHNRGFDIGFLLHSLQRSDLEIAVPPCMCSMELAINTPVEGKTNNRLETLYPLLYPETEEGPQSHRAGDDARQAGDVFMALARQNDYFRWKGCTIRAAVDFFDKNPDI